MDSSVYSTVVTANGVMFIMTRNNLYAIQEGAQLGSDDDDGTTAASGIGALGLSRCAARALAAGARRAGRQRRRRPGRSSATRPR